MSRQPQPGNPAMTTLTRRVAAGAAAAALSLSMVACSDSRDARDDPAKQEVTGAGR